MMTKTHTVVIVDPHAQTITQEETPDANATAHRIIGDDLDHNILMRPGGDPGISFILDDFAAAKKGQRYFRIRGYPHPLGGPSVFYGFDDRGDSVDLPSSFANWLRAHITWCPPTMRFVRFDDIQHGPGHFERRVVYEGETP